MLRNAFFAAGFVFFVACAQSEDSGSSNREGQQSSSSGSTAASAGSSGSSSSSGGTGGASLGVCDDAGTCGDYVSGCTGCAVADACAEVYDGCFGDDACLDFNKCLTNCMDDETCKQVCSESNPIGAERYHALVSCIVCQVCPKSCVDFAGFCP